MDDEFKPNSYKSKELMKESSRPEKKVEKAIIGSAKIRKQSEFKKVVGEFVVEEFSNVKTYLLKDVLLPWIKNGIWDMVTKGTSMLLYGESKGNPTSTVSYNRLYGNQKLSQIRQVENPPSSVYKYEEIDVESRGEAELIIETMCSLIDEYGFASLNDFYDAAGITAAYTTDNYGWRNLRDAYVVRSYNGRYLIKMPRVVARN